VHTRVIEDVAELEQLTPAWDELAVAAGCPGALPGWQLAWWRHLAPPGARLRAVAVEDEGRLVGLAPYCVETRRGRAVYRLLAASMTHRVEPIADPAAAGGVAEAIARALAAASPVPGYLAFAGADAGSAWRSAIAAGWPGRRPWELEERTSSAPVVDLEQDDFEAWLGGKSKNFRQQTRRFRRRLADAGGRARMTSSLDELERDVATFSRLHHERWAARGGSSLSHDIDRMLLDAGRSLLASERFRLWIVEVDGRPVSAQIFLAAGANALYWNGGFDAAAAELKPSLLGIIAGLEDCFARGERRLDLGGGAQDYKQRLADRDLPLCWGGLVPREGGARYARNRLALLPLQARGVARTVYRRLPPDAQERARGVLERAAALRPGGS
jgi:CelD/BcsL family acetyltransferase involved in cellulose biosynthesis